MIQSDEQHRYVSISILCLCFLIQTASTQTCQRDIPDFFNNVSFAGPLFDQAVYTISVNNFSVASPNLTNVFTFNVQPQTDYTRPSFVSTSVTGRALNLTPGIITVTSSNPNFAVIQLPNSSYSLVTNTYPLNFFVPNNRYLFNLIATQTYSNRPAVSSTALVQINLQNANAHAPLFVPLNQTFSISETAPVGTRFGVVYATDADNDGIIYSINSGQFSIDPSTGVLQLQQTFQTSTAQYSVFVTASDDGSSCSPPCPRYSTQAEIIINVTAVNKRSPQFLSQICGSTVSFYESNPIGANITTISVFDDDRGENGQITISFPSEQSRTTVSGLRNTAYTQFYLQQLPQSGTTRTAILRTNISFNYDDQGATRVWYLFVLATDNGIPQRQSFCSLRINLLDLNDNPPVFVMTTWNYTIYRSAFGNSNNPRFFRIIASDADSGSNGMVNYFIGTTNVPYFTINQTTGTIILQNNIQGLFELNVTRFPITFQVYAQDLGSPPRISETNATVTIYYNNGIDPPPARWLDPRYEELNFPIIEKYYETYGNRPIFNTSYGFNGTILYQLTSQKSSIMTVTSPFPNTFIPFSDVSVVRIGNVFSSGIVATSGLHAEFQNNYLIYTRVLVNPPLIGSATITIIDQNDQIPTFDIRSIVLSVVENESGNRVVAQIQAFDRDVDYPNNFVQYRLNYNLSDPEVVGNFFVEPNGTIWTNAIFDRESNKTLYRLFSTAYDGAPAWNSNSSNTQDFQFDIQVIDVNDVPPVFINSTSVTISINETTANGTGILNLTVTDTDFDTILDFGISSGNIKNVFSFNLLSDNSDDSSRTQYQAVGQLAVVGPLDYESISNYTLVLFAFDTQNLAQITVFVKLLPQNTKAPNFGLMPGFTSYDYQVDEGTAVAVLPGRVIQATDRDIPSTPIVYDIYNTNNQLNLNNVYLTQSNNQATIGISVPGLTRDLPFGYSVYNFSIRATDENGNGLSSYAPVSIKVIDVNNNAPIPVNSPWILNEGVTNPSTMVKFVDYDDPTQNNTIPFQVTLVNSPGFELSGATLNFNGIYTLTYRGVLNRTTTKNLTVTFNASDVKGYSALTSIPIIVGDVPSASPISDGYKTVNVIYPNGYTNSLRDISLGSIYVNDQDDWFQASRTYVVRSPTSGPTFYVNQGTLRTSDVLSPGTYTAYTDVTKTNPVVSSALSTVDLAVSTVDTENIRNAATIRIKGETPESLIDPTLGNRLNTLRNAIATFLQVTTDSIGVLAIRPVYQYRSPYFPPLTFDQAKQQALTDIVFYVPSLKKNDIENTLNSNLGQFSSRYGIIANASGPNPCTNYICPIGTTCRPTRTIQSTPYAIDTNQTSFVGVNVVDSADCVNATYAYNLTNTQVGCMTYSFNNLTYCPCTLLQSYGPLGPYCQVLGRTFNENGGGYAVFDSSKFSNLAPTRFSFDFATRSPVTDGLILLYGRNTLPVDDFFWTAIEIFQSKLRFHFRGARPFATDTPINASTWYHVEYQYVDSTILISINDCQYSIAVTNNTLNSYDLSNVQLYLGGLPGTGSLISGLYSSLTQVNTFNGCIRNVMSNGNYLDMNAPVSSANSEAGQCPCSLTNSCTTSTLSRSSDVIVPWYTWLIIALVLLLLATVLALSLLTCIKRRQQQKPLAALYADDTRDNIIDYKETAGEEDHSTYNLGVLKKPVYAISNEEILANSGGRGGGMHNIGYTDTIINRRPALGDYIDEKLNEQQTTAYANDTQLHYRYEGEGSIASDLSSIESVHYQEDHDFRFLYSWGPKFSRLADLYAGGVEYEDDDFDNA